MVVIRRLVAQVPLERLFDGRRRRRRIWLVGCWEGKRGLKDSLEILKNLDHLETLDRGVDQKENPGEGREGGFEVFLFFGFWIGFLSFSFGVAWKGKIRIASKDLTNSYIAYT